MFYIPQGDLRPQKRRVFKDGQMRELWLMNGREVADPDAGQDFSTQPTAHPAEQNEVPKAIKFLQQQFPHWRWDDDTLAKRLSDVMRDAYGGTQGESQVSRLRQTSDNRGQATHGPRFVRTGNPDHEVLDNAEAWNESRKL